MAAPGRAFRSAAAALAKLTASAGSGAAGTGAPSVAGDVERDIADQFVAQRQAMIGQRAGQCPGRLGTHKSAEILPPRASGARR